jgi:hypothetical protein
MKKPAMPPKTKSTAAIVSKSFGCILNSPFLVEYVVVSIDEKLSLCHGTGVPI